MSVSSSSFVHGIAWDPAWGELDLVVGTAVGLNGSQILLDPAAYATLTRSGVRLADVQVQGSTAVNRIFAGIGSVIDAAGGNDELFNSDSLGDNLFIGGLGSDSFFLSTQKDQVIGGTLINNGALLGLVDGAKDLLYLDLDGSSPTIGNDLQILDFELGIDQLLINGIELATSADRWRENKNTLQAAGVQINAAPVQSAAVTTQKLSLIPGLTTTYSLSEFAKDPDGDALSLLVLSAPSWFGATGSTLTIKTPKGFTSDQLAALSIQLGLSDGKAVTAFSPQLLLGSRPLGATDNQSAVSFTDPQGNIRTFAINAAGGSFSEDRPAQLLSTSAVVNSSSNEYQRLITGNGVDLATRSIDFTANVTAGTNTNVSSDVAALFDDIPQGRKLAYYAIATDGGLTPLTYNPRQRGGARFYDIDGNGRPDFLNLRLADGGYGDKDRVVNGIIDDPSTAGSLELNPVLTRSGAQTITAADPLKSSAPASLVLKATMTARTSAVQQIGYVVLEANELATADTLLTDLSALRSRSQIIFSSLESSDVVLHPETEFTREFLLVNGQSVRFFQINDATLDDLSSTTDSRLQFFSAGDLIRNRSVSLSTSAGVRFNLELLDANQGLNGLIAQEQGLAPVLDLTAFNAGQKLIGTLIMGREANLDSLIGFYRVVDTQGTVRDQNGDLVRPENKERYKNAALLSQNRIDALTGLAVGDNQTSKRSVELSGSGYLAPFMQVGSNTFFAMAEANTDGYAHFKMLGTNLFGAEDLFGGGDRDHDDLVFGFSFNQVISPLA